MQQDRNNLHVEKRKVMHFNDLEAIVCINLYNRSKSVARKIKKLHVYNHDNEKELKHVKQ